ncbi:MAG: family efflux transporter [Burkholderiaceae bacterium]|nr:family efflux transporter [Burkholderiaceae bacterium]
MTVQQHSNRTLRIVSLAWPILLGQMAVIANSVVDTMMVSRFSVTDLGALAVGASIYVSVFVGMNGVLQALSPVVGQLVGARNFAGIGQEIRQAVWLALFLSLVGCLVLLFPQPLLALANASPDLTAKATQYLRTLALALPATLGFVIYGALNNAMARPKMVMAIHVSALLLKIPLNALFIFGGLGLPALGGPGCAIATTLIAWLALATGWLILRHHPFYQILGLFGSGFVRPQWSAMKELLRIGLPIGLSFFIEVTSFTFIALFVARLGDMVVAGHQITANFATLLYMLPLSIANATGTLVAQAIGAQDQHEAQRIGHAGIRLAVIVAVSVGLIIWLARDSIVRAYTPDETVVAVALPLFLFIGFYQLFDAIQVTTSYILRAYKVVLFPTILYAAALWCVGLGGGISIGLNPFGLPVPTMISGAAGFWFSNSISLVLLACGMLWHLRRVQRKARCD